MDISSYLSSMSMAIASAPIQQAVGLSVAKMAMDTSQTQAAAITEMMPAPSFGHFMDIRA